MSSDDSDDEPLSVLAANKKLKPTEYELEIIPINQEEPRRKKRKCLPRKICNVTIKMQPKVKKVLPPPVIERPTDVWMYLKDLNPAGPYSCLLCPEWFVNRSKIIIHYVCDHKKDFCGICRYFVPDRESWWKHMKFHTPWACSQCVDNFETENDLREHLSRAHRLVHCRLCHFRLSDDDQYNTHLFQKHNVSNVSCKNEEIFWELEYDGASNFLCLLCSQSNNSIVTFFTHFMGYHHFTLKCFTRVISGKDPPFHISGADVTSEFIESQLKNQAKHGYVDLKRKPDFPEAEPSMYNESNNLLSVLLPEIKNESTSEQDDSQCEDDAKQSSCNDELNEVIKNYKGDEDFDVTLMELIMLQRCYYNYVNETMNNINMNLVPENSDIDYENSKSDIIMEVDCGLCDSKHDTLVSFTGHMMKMHSVKSVPVYSCRICATVFDSQSELDGHITEELKEFHDLWLCQFCDKEFDSREATRKHLTKHWDQMEFDNCFSPHLGYKCKYCPTLFWNETDRETHQVRTHFQKYTEEYYKCVLCNETYSDKIWFIHHYLDKHQSKDNNPPTYLLKCCMCCVVLPKVEEMRTHFVEHHPEARKVFCSLDTCKYKPLSQRKSFRLHLRTVHNPAHRSERRVNCRTCGREFGSGRACSAHMTQMHGPGKFKCKLCREVLQTLDERKLHYLIRHPGRHPFECGECGKSFQYKSSLYMHKQVHAPNKETYTCTYCGKVFMKKDSFREHLQIHEGPRHACSYCPMRFVQRSNMLRHERRHTGERPYACPQCHRTFADKGACTSHTRTHLKEPAYSCMYCGQTFAQKSKLTYHTRKHTGENLETCTLCSKLFTSGCALREHMKTHTRKKERVKCPLCDRIYQDERSMLRHMRTGHTRSKFTCPLCHKTLTSAVGLRQHVVTHSSLNNFRCKICPKSYSVQKTMLKHLRKRHGLKGTEINIKDFFRRLDPRECQLGLDEEIMCSIFGPPKKKSNDLLISDYITIHESLDLSKPKGKTRKSQRKQEKLVVEEKQDSPDEQSSEETPTEKPEEESPEKEIPIIKIERRESDEELEPTDFVSVKIECIEEVDPETT